MGHFTHLTTLPPDPILELMWAFKRDTRQKKIDLSVGIYYNDNLQPEILKTVLKAEEALLQLETDKSYLPIDGHAGFIEQTKKIIFGEKLLSKLTGSIYGAQTVGGTGALRVAGEFLAASIGKTIYVPNPTWANHMTMFLRAGLETKTYPYYDMVKHTIIFEDMMECLKKLPEKAIILLHGCCHNPTGTDLTHEQWKEVSTLMLKRKLVPLFDMAYQGFGDGLEEDAFAVRYFAEQGHEMLVAFSYAKIFGLYAERVGALMVLSHEKETLSIASHIKSLIRSNYSNPPKHGASIVSYALAHEPLKNLWLTELTAMRNRIKKMRTMLLQVLIQKIPSKDYSYIDQTKGMFCFLNLEPRQVERLIQEQGIYMTKTGRINVTGLSEENLHAVIDAVSVVALS